MTRTLVAVLMLSFCGARAVPDDATAVDLKRLQGDWAAVSMAIDGVKSSDDEAQCLFRTVKGNSYILYFFKRPFGRYQFTIDASKRPPTIDITPPGTPATTKPMRGIYKLDEKRWTICVAAAGKARPKDFTSKAGSGNQLSVWEREQK